MNESEKPIDFAFIAGLPRSEEKQPPRVPLNEFDSLAEGVSILLDWRYLRPFSCLVRVADIDSEYQAAMKIWPMPGSYEVRNLNWDNVESFDAESFIITENGKERKLGTYAISFGVFETHLIFSTSLQIWGRPNDYFKIIGARSSADEIILELKGNKDDRPEGELTINRELRHAVSMDTNVQSIQYTDIQPLYSWSE